MYSFITIHKFNVLRQNTSQSRVSLLFSLFKALALCLLCIQSPANFAQSSLPEVSIEVASDYSEDGGLLGSSRALFFITLSEPSAAIVTVDFMTVAGSATPNLDYAQRSGKVIFQPGRTRKIRSVEIIQDSMDEPDEDFSMMLMNPVNATLAVNQATTTIVDNSGGSLPEVRISGASVSEINSRVKFEITLTKPNVNDDVFVNFETVDGTATAGMDYEYKSGRIKFRRGETFKRRSVIITQDPDFEDDETFTMQLSNPQDATISIGSATATIRNDDLSGANPILTVADVTVSESDGDAEFTATLSKPYTTTATVNFETVDGTASSGGDFVGRTGKITFLPGEVSKKRKVTLINDSVAESTESFAVLFNNNNDGTNTTAFASIIDDDTNNESIVTMGTGDLHNCALLSSGTVKCWGANGQGRLGNGTLVVNSPVPDNVLGINSAVALGVGRLHNCAVLDIGEIRCWGHSAFGQLGYDSTHASTTPVRVDSITNAVTLSATEDYTCALIADGTLECWGKGWGHTPVKVNGISNAISIQSSNGYNCSQLNTGSIKCWSSNENITEAFNIGTVTSLGVGGGHACAVNDIGETHCWGNNSVGQLGNGGTTFSPIPTKVIGIADAIAVSASADFTCVIKGTGSVKCWGLNNDGQLGDGNFNNISSLPVDVIGINNAQSLTTGANYVCAVIDDGGIKCWGNNVYGQLGNGDEPTTTIRSTTAVDVTGIDNALNVYTGMDRACAILTTGLSCWGNNIIGQLGNGLDGRSVPLPIDTLNLSNVTSMSIGWRHSCARLATGEMKCWGQNGRGEIGDGTIGMGESVPKDVLSITNVLQVSAGKEFTCALLNDGKVNCWGLNATGTLGNGTTTNSSLPVEVNNLTNVVSLDSGHSHSCVITDSGGVKCWGANAFGQLGDSTTNSSFIPVDVLNINNAVFISVAGDHSCAVLNNGIVRCWGRNHRGQLGNDSKIDSLVPIDVLTINNASSVSISRNHSCALLITGNIKCWGEGFFGALGYGSDSDSLTPVDVVDISNATAISSGDANTCALLDTGALKCWGDNRDGILGNGTFEDALVPVDVSGITNAVSIISGSNYARQATVCAVLDDAKVKCWGVNQYGQIGNGAAWSRVPTTVVNPF